ncbi:predicted protein [Nematostella vectensis]|uniref:F5/8 type C domain-containing protein n=1 Tax=Nematostella vectensis TaxID=45351 RepID=A7SYC6_NEMVE|nr:predicted protein [Nematostella vectensis]|eukprot:XP_001623387.1 predicted protein [Nematostella vectensis]
MQCIAVLASCAYDMNESCAYDMNKSYAYDINESCYQDTDGPRGIVSFVRDTLWKRKAVSLDYVTRTLMVHAVQGNEAKLTSSSGIASRGTLNYAKTDTLAGSCCLRYDPDDYLQVDLLSEKLVTAVATQGDSHIERKVLEYTLSFSLDETEWWDYMEDNIVRGNEAKLTSSYCDASRGTLNYAKTDTHAGSCCLRYDPDDYLQVDLLSEKLVTAVATQGDSHIERKVLEYTLSFSLDETEWWDYMEDNIVRHFVGNTGNRNMVVTRTLNSSVRAQYVRFYPKKAYGLPCIRVEVYGCPVSEALGVEDGRIPDLNMSSSSARGPGFEAYRGRLNNLHGNGSWCSNMSLPKNQQYLRIDLGNVWEVTAVETQGNPFLYCEMVMKTVNCSDFNSSALPGELCEVPAQYCRGSWVKMFSLDYSLDGKEWRKYGEEGITKEFTANENPNSTVRNYLKGVTARLISIQPKDFKFRMCLRIEIHGREACTGDLGISNGRIPDGQLSSSSTAGLNYAAKYARLMNPTRVWCASPDDPTPYLQIDLYSTHRVRFIETRGHVVNGSGLWVASYYLQFSVDGEEWYNYTRGGTVQIFAGNTNGNNIAKRDLPGPIVAVYIRIKPVTWVGYTACLRIDFKGCKVCSDALGLESGEIENDAIQSNLYDQFAEPYNARLRMNKRGWLTTEHLLNVKLFIIVDFGPGLAVVNGIATQGYGSYHVARYTLSYSEDMVLWRDHTENGMKRPASHYGLISVYKHSVAVSDNRRSADLVSWDGFLRRSEQFLVRDQPGWHRIYIFALEVCDVWLLTCKEV